MDCIAVFVDNEYPDIGRARVWAKTAAVGHFVLLTDEPTDNNHAIVRQLKCANVVHALVRLPGTMRLRPSDLAVSRFQRDEAMIRIATRIVLFGELAPWRERFSGKRIEHFQARI